MKSSDVATHAGVLEKVYQKVRAGEMPPAAMPRLDKDTTTKLLSWLETSLDKNAAAMPNPGAPAIHRLNRAEYRNAIRDLLGLDSPDIGNDLPADDSGYGFDNIGDALSVSPLHMERYVSSGRRISRLAVGTLKASTAVEKYNPPRGGEANGRLPLPINERGGFTISRYFPFDAEYSILVRGRGAAAPGMPAPKLDVRIDGKRLKLINADMDTEEANQGTRNFELRVPLSAGKHEISAAMLTETARIEAGRGGGASAANAAGIEYITIGGPYNAKGPGETESRKRIFVCRPSATAAEEQCARTILTGLAHRAYRRPVVVADVDPLMRLFKEGKQDGGDFDHGIEMALNGILVSPNFLYRVEDAPAGTPHGSNYSVSDLDLASRLSFFLWSSIPDDELLGLAEQKRLRDPAVLKAQVQRMLRDPKSRSLVDNFAGQWLQLRNVADWKPDPDKFPGVDDSLRYAFQQETELFFENMIRENRGILELIDADYTFLNDRLARYYGISGVSGGYFRRVDLSRSSQRGGVLTQGSILMVTSYPTRTSPVLRGKWVLENILGSPPPPPPPDVPPLSDDAQISAKSLRELLAKHRANAACASCHSRLDPLGFSLENFDAAGKFRSTEGGEPVEASGSLPDGTQLDGPSGLKHVLLARRDEFVECFVEKLLTYALGRGLESYDRPTVREIRREAERDGYRFETVVQAIVDSVPFQLRRAP